MRFFSSHGINGIHFIIVAHNVATLTASLLSSSLQITAYVGQDVRWTIRTHFGTELVGYVCDRVERIYLSA